MDGVEIAAQAIDIAAGLDERQLKVEEVLLSQCQYIFDKPPLRSYEATHFSEIPAALELREKKWNFMQQGIFAELSALWRSYDNHIIIWGFDTATSEYSVNSPIRFAEVVKPKSFLTNVDFVLVVATDTEVSLHGIKKGSTTFQMHPLPYKVPIEGEVTCVRGSRLGRIFLGTDNGNVLEFRYDEEAQVNWFRSPTRCSKQVVRSGSMLPQFLQRILGGQPDGVRQLEIDATRGLLYAITFETVSIFTLEQMNFVCDLSLSNAVRDLQPRSITPRRIVKVYPLSFSESEDLLFQGIMSDGSRLFFRGFWAEASARLHRVCAAFLRPPPQKNLVVVDGFGGQGITLLCTTTGITAINEDPKAFAQRQSGGGYCAFSEYVESMPLAPISGSAEGKVFAITESPGWTESLPELASSATISLRRRFICFSSLGIMVFSKNRPVDVMQHVLLQGDEVLLQAFFQDYTPEQAAAMCFQIASNGGSLPREVKATRADQQKFAHTFTMPAQNMAHSRALAIPESPEVNYSGDLAACVYKAESVLFSPQSALLLGEPREKVGDRPAQRPLGFAMSDDSKETPRIRGLCLYASRLLRPLWMHTILIPVAASNGKRGRDGVPLTMRYEVRWSKSERLEVLRRLQRLLSLLQRAQSLRTLLQAEQETCRNISRLLERSIEALEFLSMLRPPVQNLDLLVSFRDMVLSGGSRLVRGCELDMSQVAKLCPHLVSEGEAKLQSCLELVNRIVKAREKRDDEVAISIADRMMEHLLANVPLVNLAVWGPLLRKAGCLKCLIELCVRKARLCDPTDEAIKRSDAQAHFSRMMCYQVGLAAFEDLKQAKIVSNGSGLSETACPRNLTVRSVIPVVFTGYHEVLGLLDSYLQWTLINSLDELWHVCVFKWMVQEGRAVYTMDSPFLLNFLHQPVHRELLCKYYHHRKSYADATEAYLTLAFTAWDAVPERPLSLEERLSYLNTALTTSASDERRTQDIQNVINCVKVQQVAKAEIEDRITEAAGSNTAPLTDALRTVQDRVINVTTLYNDIACPHRLYETCIAVRYYNDNVQSDGLRELVRRLLMWRQRVGDLRHYIVRLWSRYGSDGKFLPLDAMCDILIQCANESGLEPQWVLQTLEEARVPYNAIADALRNTPCGVPLWMALGDAWTRNIQRAPASEKSALAQLTEDLRVNAPNNPGTHSLCARVERVLALQKSS